MTQRETKIIAAILAVLHELDGGQIPELPLHAEVNLLVTCTATEFGEALKICDRRKWAIGIQGKYTGRKWNLSDAGEAARLEM